MGTGAVGIGAGVNDIGGAVGALFGAKANKRMAAGYDASAASYGRAATLAYENAGIVRESTALQKTMQEREIYKTIGGQQADVAGAGFTAGGSALDLLRDSTAQGQLTMELIQKQGDINEKGYLLQAEGFLGQQSLATAQADSARISAKGQQIAAMIKGVSAVVNFASV